MTTKKSNSISMIEKIKRWWMAIDYTWYCGRHSGIPPCCRLFFIGPWRWIYHGKKHSKLRLWIYRKIFLGDKSNCIRCPFCLFFKMPVVRTKPCNCRWGKKGEVISDSEAVSRGW